MRVLIGVLGLALATLAADVRVAAPAGTAAAAPFSPGLMVNDFLYVSGQGPVQPGGETPTGFEAQMRQALANVKAVLEAGGLTMQHVVFAHVYLTDMGNYPQMDRLWSETFQVAPPARAVLGVYKLPGDVLVEINAVAFRDLARRRVLVPPGYPERPASPGVIAGEKVYLSGFTGTDLRGEVPDDPFRQVEMALEHMKRTLAVAGLDYRHVVFVNPYQTSKAAPVMNKVYASRFEFGNTPARATIEATSLPFGANIEFSGVAVLDLSKRQAVRPKNMPPSPTASPCVWGDDTLYCSAKSAFIPGPNLGIYMPGVEGQVRQSIRNLLDGLEEAGLKLSNVVAANVYLDDMNDFPKMNRVYTQYFPDIKPTRTTVAQVAPGAGGRASRSDTYPELEQISIIAVR